MAWLIGGGRKKGLTEAERAQLLREQSSQLLTTFPAILSPIDQLRFQGTLHTRFGNLVFYVLLPPDYPDRPPRVQVAVSVSHPWVDSNGLVTGLPLLRPENWNTRSTLLQAVQPVITQFQNDPPVPRGVGQPATAQPIRVAQPLPMGNPLPANSGQPGAVGNAAPGGNPGVSPQEQKNNNPAAELLRQQQQQQFAILDSYGISQLEEALIMDDALDRILSQMEPVKSTQATREQLYEELERQAEANLQNKQEVENLTKDVLELKHLAQQRSALLSDLYARQQAVLKHFSRERVLAELDNLVAQADEAGEEIYDAFNGRRGSSSDSSDTEDPGQFDDGDDSDGGDGANKSPAGGKAAVKQLTAPKFVKSYRKARQKYHTLAAKRECLV